MYKRQTTAGTGSEVTAFSVITDTSRNYKLTVFSYELLPKYALLDPEMIMSVPPMVAASCGIDALIHAWEAYTSLGASPFSDAMAEKAMELIGGNIRRFVANRKDEEAAVSYTHLVMAAVLAFKGSGWALLVGFAMNLLLSNMDFQKKKLGALTTEELDQVEAKRNEEVQRLLAQKNQE